MSASLVGSEMCIRDRPYAAGAFEATPSSLMDWLRRESEMRLTLATRVGSVSYTHLTLPTICSV
eukprot:8114151-Alexandrium_andersonii.AAC.1